MADFIKHQYKNYVAIKEFTDFNTQNFESLDPADKAKADVLIEYFKNDDLPGEKFPQIKKVHDELRESINEHFSTLQKKTKAIYEDTFTELEQKAKKFKVQDVRSFYDASTKLRDIENEKNITNLQLLLANVDKFKVDIVEQMVKSIRKDNGDGKEVERFKTKVAEITTEEELDKYLDLLRQELIQKLKENKIIIIE